MIVAGRVSQKMAPVLRQISRPDDGARWVISAQACCASSGRMFNNYAIVQGVDTVPVDVYVPGARGARDPAPRHRHAARVDPLGVSSPAVASDRCRRRDPDGIAEVLHPRFDQPDLTHDRR